jgi:hypothetical protein
MGLEYRDEQTAELGGEQGALSVPVWVRAATPLAAGLDPETVVPIAPVDGRSGRKPPIGLVKDN